MDVLVFDLKGYRIANGMSQEDVAKRVGVSKELISYYERHKENVKLSTISMMAEKLNVIPSTFIRELDESEVAFFDELRKGRVMSVDEWVDRTIREVEEAERKALEGDLI